MSKFKAKRAFKASNQNLADLTNENYEELSFAYQILAQLAEAKGIAVAVAEYEERKYIHRSTLEAVVAELFEPAAAAVVA